MLSLPNEPSEKPDEGLFVLVVALCGDVVILQILLPVECYLLSLHFAVFDVALVPDKDNGDVLTDSNQVFVPLSNVLVCYSSSHVEHNQSCVASDAANGKG